MVAYILLRVVCGVFLSTTKNRRYYSETSIHSLHIQEHTSIRWAKGAAKRAPNGIHISTLTTLCACLIDMPTILDASFNGFMD